MTPTLTVCWLHELPEIVQAQYFEARRRCYAERWRQRLDLEGEFGLRDSFDTEHVVVALDAAGRVRGGVRANVVRPAGSSDAHLLPIEQIWTLRLRDLFPDHPLDRVSYAEASRLFVCDPVSWLEGQTMTLCMLNFLLDGVPNVTFAYFGLPFTLLRIYRLLARSRRVEYVYRELPGLRPHARASGASPVRWGVFACTLLPDALGEPAGGSRR